MQKTIAITALVIILLAVNGSIYKKEALLEKGQVVYLKLAPVDPRSLMQGDFMALRFAMAAKITEALKASELVDAENYYYDSVDGLVNVQLDDKNVASFAHLVSNDYVSNKVSNEGVVMQFRLRKGRVKFATSAFFFEEGSRQEFETARYGEFRVGASGELLLVALRDKKLNKLG
jgi:uncharacterized membrane-anchored protein